MINFIVLASHVDWWGGWAYGPRFLTDMIPYFMYFMVPLFMKLPDFSTGRKTNAACMIICLISFSFFVNYRGATVHETWLWNDRMHTNDLENARLWDWGDLQFLAGIT